MTRDDSPAPRKPGTPTVAVQILTVIFYTGFAITVSIVAMAMFGLIGIALALFLAWQWGRVAAFGRPAPALAETQVDHTAPTRNTAPTGNAAFDAYRHDMLARLEAEQAEFMAFLDRLRHARDAEEFESFVTDRTPAKA
jgi:hypothetical protein